MAIKFLLVRLSTFFAVVVFSTAIYASNSWNDYHWARTTSPFTLLVVDSMTSDWDYSLTESLAWWSDTTVLDLSITDYNDSKGTRKKCGAVEGQLRVCNAKYGNNGWLGLATIYLDSNKHITRASAKMNDSYASFWTFEEMNHVTCQEIGHTLGLDHTSTDGSSQQSCMDYSSDPASQWPNQHDLDELFAIYAGHSDSYDSYDTGSSTDNDGGSSGCNAPPGKGCNKNAASGPPMGVRVIKGKNHEIWVAPGKDGGLWIHHIRLVPEYY